MMPIRKCSNEKCPGKRSMGLAGLFSKRKGEEWEGMWFCSRECRLNYIREKISAGLSVNRRKRRIEPKLRIGEQLLVMKKISGEQLDMVLKNEDGKEEKIGRRLVDMGLAEERDITLALSKQYNLPWIDVRRVNIPAKTLAMIPPFIALNAGILPLEWDWRHNRLLAVMENPGNGEVIDFIESVLRVELSILVTDDSALQEALQKYYSDGQQSTENKTEHSISLDDVDGLDRIVRSIDDSEYSISGGGKYNSGFWIRMETRDKWIDVYLRDRGRPA